MFTNFVEMGAADVDELKSVSGVWLVFGKT
jgi:hypothetical protein